MKIQPPLLAEMVPEREIAHLSEVLGERVRIEVLDQRNRLVAQCGRPPKCPFTYCREIAGKGFAATCTEEQAEWIRVLLNEEGRDRDLLACKGNARHFVFIIKNRCQDDSPGARDRSVGLVMVGPVINAGDKKIFEDEIFAVEEAGRSEDLRMIVERLPYLSDLQIEFIERQGLALARAISRKYQEAASQRNVSVAMPFAPESEGVWHTIRKALAELGYCPNRVDHTSLHEASPAVICKEIGRAAFLVADISGHNSNLLWEIGYAQATGKQILLLTQDDDPPFSVRGQPIIEYKSDALSELNDRIKECIRKWQRCGQVAFDYDTPAKPSLVTALDKPDGERVASSPPAESRDAKPLWQRIVDLGNQVPEEEWAKVPSDLSVHLDHYLYGSPKSEE